MTEQSGPITAPLPPVATRVVGGALAVSLMCMVILAVFRAGWLDEYWTTWHSDPHNGLVQAYWTRWLRDTPHPPFYYALSWLLGPLTGPTLVARRLVINGLALLLLVPTLLAARREGRLPPAVVLLGLVIASGPYFLVYFAEHRSYFFALVATTCLVVTVRTVHAASTRSGGVIGRPLLVWLGVNTLIAVNIHYTIALCGLALLFCEFLWQGIWGSRRLALTIAGIVIMALVPLLFHALLATSLLPVPVVVDQSLVRGIGTLAFMAAVGPAANVVVLWMAGRTLWRDRAAASLGTPQGAGFVLVLLATLVLLGCGFLVLQVWKHNVIPRLLIGLIPVATALVCELAARVSWSRQALLLAGANAALVTGAVTANELRNGRWEYHIPAIRAEIAACPDTRVIALNPIYLLPRDNANWSMTGQEQAMALSYRRIAEKWGFRVSVAPHDPVPAAPARCPTLVWLEHNFFRPGLTEAEMLAMAGLPAAGAGTRLTRDRNDSHDLLIVRKAAPPNAPNP